MIGVEWGVLGVFTLIVLIAFCALCWIERPPRYCEDCGTRLVERTALSRYDRITGKKVFSKTEICPFSLHYDSPPEEIG